MSVSELEALRATAKPTTAQELAAPAVEWLLDPFGHFGSGRTYLMAETFINLAKKYPGRSIHVFDHIQNRHQNFAFLAVAELVEKSNDPLFKLDFNNHIIRYKKES